MVQLLLTLTLLAAAPGGGEDVLRRWSDLPERWLFLPNEERKFRSLETSEEQDAFLEELWKRRDPAPSDVANPARQRFYLRVEQANELFSGEGRQGSMTDRGRVYLLVGPPSQITQKYLSTPRFSPLTVAGPTRERSKVLVEHWSWRPEDLSPEVRQLLELRRWKIPLTVEFRVSPTRYSLLDGEELIRLSTRALVRPAER